MEDQMGYKNPVRAPNRNPDPAPAFVGQMFNLLSQYLAHKNRQEEHEGDKDSKARMLGATIRQKGLFENNKNLQEMNKNAIHEGMINAAANHQKRTAEEQQLSRFGDTMKKLNPQIWTNLLTNRENYNPNEELPTVGNQDDGNVTGSFQRELVPEEQTIPAAIQRAGNTALSSTDTNFKNLVPRSAAGSSPEEWKAHQDVLQQNALERLKYQQRGRTTSQDNTIEAAATLAEEKLRAKIASDEANWRAKNPYAEPMGIKPPQVNIPPLTHSKVRVNPPLSTNPSVSPQVGEEKPTPESMRAAHFSEEQIKAFFDKHPELLSEDPPLVRIRNR
jgi:hypothetical protein